MTGIGTWVSAVVAAALLAAGLPGGAGAQTFPQRPITMVVAYAPGGPSDNAARAIVDKMSAVLGQQIVVENIAGAGGMTGAQRVARAEPDGHTLLMHQTGLVIGPALYPRLNFDVDKELAPIGLVNISYSFLVGRKNLPPNTLAELIAWMKQPGNRTKFAHPGTGTLAHLQAVLFLQATGTEADLIPYRGGGPAMNDIVGGHVDLVWAATSTSEPLLKAGTVKAFGIGADKPYAPLPQYPAFGEVGPKELAIDFWHALFAPAATPRPVIDKLNAALRETIADPQVKTIYAQRGIEAPSPELINPEAARDFVRKEAERWGKVIRENNIQGEP